MEILLMRVDESLRGRERVLAAEAAKEALLREACERRGVPVKRRCDLLRTEAGRPFLPGNPFCFSYSDSGRYVCLGIGDAPLGVDVQEITRRPDVGKLARRFYRAEEALMLEREPDADARRRHFFRLWAMKEAFLKYVGTGLERPMDSFVIDEAAGVIRFEGGTCYVTEIPLEEGYVLCACAGERQEAGLFPVETGDSAVVIPGGMM